MSLIGLMVAVIIAVLCVYVIRLLVGEQPWRNILIVLVVLVLILWLLGGYIPRFRVY
jgi:hypothetical protein